MADGTTDSNEVLAAEIGPEGTIANLQAKMPKIRAGSATDGFVEEKPAAASEGADGKTVEEIAAEEAAAAKAAEGKTPEEIAAEAKAASTDKSGKGDKSKPDKWAKKSKEDVIKAHEEAERKITEATTQAAKDKEAREIAEKETAELKTKLEEALAKPPEKPAEKAKPITGEDRKARVKAATKTALATIRELDRTNENYNDQLEDAWTEALLEAGMSELPLTQAEIDKMVKDSLKADKEAEAATQDEKRKKDEADEGARIEVKARELGSKAGLDLDDPESADSIIWDRMSQKIPQEVYDKNSLEAQVEWVTAEVHKRTGKVVETSEAEKERARKAQIKNSVLPRGNSRPPDQESKPEEYSLASLQKADREKRAARHRGA